ncbi:unnamed protein product [Absidia cylindrospora]
MANTDDCDHLTHPQMYRESINCPTSNKKNQPLAPSTGTNDNDSSKQTLPNSNQGQQEDQWDLYPQLIREIENTGTPEQVDHLHDLERSPGRSK